MVNLEDIDIGDIIWSDTWPYKVLEKYVPTHQYQDTLKLATSKYKKEFKADGKDITTSNPEVWVKKLDKLKVTNWKLKMSGQQK